MRRIVMLAIGILAAAPVTAQEVAQPQPQPSRGALPAAVRDGRWLLDFTLQESAAGIGGWYMMSRRNAMGMNLSADFETESDTYETPDTTIEHSSERLSFAIEPAYRRYLRGSGNVASYFQVGGTISGNGFSSDEGAGESYTSWRFGYGANAGVGLQWFVTDALAISGQLMVRATYSPFVQDDDNIRREASRFTIRAAQPRATFSLIF